MKVARKQLFRDYCDLRMFSVLFLILRLPLMDQLEAFDPPPLPPFLLRVQATLDCRQHVPMAGLELCCRSADTYSSAFYGAAKLDNER